MNQEIEQLVEVLQQTESLYIRLTDIIEQEKNAALNSDVDHLTSAGEEKQGVLSQLDHLEQQRMRLLQRISQASRIPCRDLTLSKLAASAEAPCKQQLSGLQQTLPRVVSKVRHSNDECRILIQHCLRLVQNSLGFFQHWIGTANVYNVSGDLRRPVGSGGRLLSGTV